MNEAMTPERWARVKALFAAALETPTGDRAVFLEREAADDFSLLTEVASLLAAHEKPGDFMDAAPTELRAEALGLGPRGNHIGERIGAYTVTGLIARGGMGSVWRAARADGRFEGEVAIKFVHLQGGAGTAAGVEPSRARASLRERAEPPIPQPDAADACRASDRRGAVAPRGCERRRWNGERETPLSTARHDCSLSALGLGP